MSFRQTIELQPEQLAWVKGEAGRRGVTVRELFRQLVDEGRAAPAEEAAAADRRSARQRFLDAVREVYDPSLAADQAGVSYGLVKRWLDSGNAKNASFLVLYEEARQHYRAAVQRDLVEVGRGRMKGYALGLLGFLNANTEEYGQVKLRQIHKIVDPLFNDFLDIVEGELGPQAQAVLARVIERLEAAKEDRLARLE